MVFLAFFFLLLCLHILCLIRAFPQLYQNKKIVHKRTLLLLHNYVFKMSIMLTMKSIQTVCIDCFSLFYGQFCYSLCLSLQPNKYDNIHSIRPSTSVIIFEAVTNVFLFLFFARPSLSNKSYISFLYIHFVGIYYISGREKEKKNIRDIQYLTTLD